MTKKLTAAAYVLHYAKHRNVEGVENANIRRYTWDAESLGRVFNEGRGFLMFATFYDDILILNELLLSKKELADISRLLSAEGIKFDTVELGYPMYYFHGLQTMYAEKIGKLKRREGTYSFDEVETSGT